MDGLRLLLSDDVEAARTLARELETINARRQTMDQEILEQAVDHIEREVDLEQSYGLVLARDGWHPGVIGIVASRLVERFGRPTILVALEGEEGRGSGRSIPGFDLHAALVQCASHLARFGGHTMAAGLTVRRDRLDAFRDAFNAHARGRLTPNDLVPAQRIDLVVRLDELDLRLEHLLQALEPCGPGNPAPVFGTRGAVARVLAVEYLVLGALAGGVGALAAAGFSWGLVTFVFEGRWDFSPPPYLAAWAGTALLIASSDVQLDEKVSEQQTEERSYSAGEAQWFEGVGHVLTNTGKEPAQVIVLEFKKGAGSHGRRGPRSGDAGRSA